MHTAGKVLLILGGIITVIGIVMIVGGAAAASFDPTEENVTSKSYVTKIEQSDTTVQAV